MNKRNRISKMLDVSISNRISFISRRIYRLTLLNGEFIFVFWYSSWFESFEYFIYTFTLHCNLFLRFSKCYLYLKTIRCLKSSIGIVQQKKVQIKIESEKTVSEKSVSFDLRNLQSKYMYKPETHPICNIYVDQYVY